MHGEGREKLENDMVKSQQPCAFRENVAGLLTRKHAMDSGRGDGLMVSCGRDDLDQRAIPDPCARSLEDQCTQESIREKDIQ